MALTGVTESQLPPALVVTEAAKVIVPPTLVTETICGFAPEPLVDCVNDKLLCETDSVAVGETINVTGIVWGLFATLAGVVAVSVIDPE